jgi:hypothetical protein
VDLQENTQAAVAVAVAVALLVAVATDHLLHLLAPPEVLSLEVAQVAKA